MKTRISAALATAVLAVSISAASAQTFNVATMPAAEARKNLDLVIRLAIAGRNCQQTSVTEKDIDKLNAFDDALKAKLKMPDSQYERQVESPAFSAYEKNSDGFCKTFVPQIQGFVQRIP